MKGNFLLGGVLVILLSWVANYAYFESRQLAQPIFLDHYYQAYINDDQHLTFYYLTNKQDPLEVVNVIVDGMEGVHVYQQGFGSFIWDDESATRYVQEFRHRYLKSVTIQFNKDSIPALAERNSTVSFETIKVYFNDQTTLRADIGTVILANSDSNQRVFDSRMSSSSNQHLSKEAIVAIEPLTVERITFPFAKRLDDDVAVKVDLNQEKLKQLEAVVHGGERPKWVEDERKGEWEESPGILLNDDLFPFKLKENEWLGLNMYFNPDRDTYFEFSINLEGTTESGTPFVHHSPIIDQPYLDQQAIDKLIAEKAGEN